MDRALANQLFENANARRWQLPLDVFINALERGAQHAFAGRQPSDTELHRYFTGLHVADLALACACAMGQDEAWHHFVAEFRPVLYRSADAIDPTGRARDVAEALYAELFGLRERDGIRQSLFRYFHGRSSLATWLRSLVAQRWVDRHRESGRLEPLSDESADPPTFAPSHLRTLGPDPDRVKYVTAMRAVLAAAVAGLVPRDRFRVGCYYAQGMTLAQIGKLTREHEATVSRQLARTRRAIRTDVERRLQREHGFSTAEIDECFSSLAADAGDLDLDQWFGRLPHRSLGEGGRKKSPADRSSTKAADGTEHHGARNSSQ
jgi:RNA polymerase sigma-70 factor (ECF subfamily)